MEQIKSVYYSLSFARAIYKTGLDLGYKNSSLTTDFDYLRNKPCYIVIWE